MNSQERWGKYTSLLSQIVMFELLTQGGITELTLSFHQGEVKMSLIVTF